MNDLTRREVIGLTVAAGLAAGGIGRAAGAEVGPTTPLDDAIRAFNSRALSDTIGRREPPLDRDEVVAALRWASLDRATLPVSDATFGAIRAVAESGEMPSDFEFEVLTGYEPNDQAEFEVWSVRLRVPRTPSGTHAVTIRERMIRSRAIGEEEREVIHRWEAKESPGSLQRAAWMKQYRSERAEAALRDRARKP
jgi:hypothetical protein